MHERRVFFERGERIDDSGQLSVFDPDVVDGVLGEIPVLGDDKCHCLADKSHSIGCQGPLIHRLAQHDNEGISFCLDIAPSQHRDHAGPGGRLRRIDGQNFRMSVGRTQDSGMQSPRPNRQIIREIAAAGQQSCVLDPLHRAAEPTLFRCLR